MFHVKKKLDSYTYESNQSIQNSERLRNVNLDHPLARGLAVARVASSNGIVSGKYVVCGRKLIPAEVISYTLPVFIADRVTTGECTIVAGIWRDSTTFSTNQSYIQLTGPDTGQVWDTNIEYLLLNTTGSTTEERLLLLHNSSTVGVSGNIQNNSTYTSNIVTVNAAGPGSASLYRNGAQIYASAIMAGAFPWNTGTTRNLAVGNATLGMYATHLFFYTKALTTSERAELDGDPFQIFEPKKIWIPVSATPAREIADEPDASIAFGPYPEVQRPSVNSVRNSVSVSHIDTDSTLDYSNPLTTGLVAASINQGTRQDITNYTNTGGFTLDRDGVFIQGGQYFEVTTGRVSNIPLTVVTLMRSGSSGSDVTLFSSYLDGSNLIALKLTSSNQPYAVVQGSGTSGVATSPVSILPNQFITVGAIFNSTNERSVWVNGVKTAINNTNLTAGSSANNRWGASGAGSYFAGTFKIRLVWNRALSDGEMKSICENPWQVFLDNSGMSPIVLGPRNLITQASSPSKIKKRISADVQEIPNNIISGFSDNLEINYEHPLAGNLISWVIPPRRAYSKIVGGVGYYQRLAYASSSNVFATGPYTVVTKLYYDDRTTQTQFSTILTVTQYTTWATDIDEIGITSDTGANIFVFKRQNTSSLPTSIAGPSTGSVVDTSIIVPSTSGGDGSSWAYMNGTYYSINTPFGSTPTFATGKTRTVAAGSVSAKVYAAYLFVFNKQLSLAEINSVHRDPWGLLKATPYNTSKFAYIKSADSGILIPPVLSNPSVSDITTTTALPSVKVEF